MATVRAKFVCNSKTVYAFANGGGSVKFEFGEVYSNEPDHENKNFWDATPSGEISMWISNPPAFARFKEAGVDAEFYVDFTPAPKAGA